jgi:amino acid transporter
LAQSNKFGTFKGVFTPSILTILGVIMYMRLPMIVGEAGLFATIGIIVIAHIISASTSLSVSSIATDKKVKAGGTYYMISRSLGLPIGGTLGLALFVGLSFSVSLYLIGFAESFLGYWGYEININNIRIAGSAILLLVTIITFISTSLALKTQYFIMAAIALSLLSIALGQHEFTPDKPLLTSSPSAVPLMVLFGIFFPAVTGFEAGVSMSGDLKDPKKSIPLGAMAAVLVGFVAYIALAFFFSYTVDAKTLADDPKVLLKIAWLPELVLAGIWGATLSSALGSILGAPRILQATAVDKITPKLFAKGTGKTNEPRNALILTFLIAEGGILIGELDIIARVVSIFFITTYGFLNLSAAFERMTSADFRPTFKPPVWISLVGAIACFIVMIQLDFVAMVAASGILLLLYLYLKRKELVLRSGDAWSSIWASLVKKGLKRLNKETIETRNWRPNVLMFSGEQENRPYLVELGKDLTNRLGILTGFEMQVSNESLLLRKKKFKTEDFFMNVHTCRDVYEGMDEVTRVYGFSGVEPNSVLMGWNQNPNHRQKFIEFIQRLGKNNLNALFVNYKSSRSFGDYKSIDIWWSGWGNNLSFAITILRHLTSSSNWKDAKIRLLAITNESGMDEKLYNMINKIVEEFRLTMEVKVVDNSVDKLPVNEIVWRESANTCLTILGISAKKKEQIEKTYEFTNKIIEKLGTTLMISASDDFEEHNLVAEVQPGKKLPSIQEKLELPELKYTDYLVINEEIKRIDNEWLSKLDCLFEKAFRPYFVTNENIINDLQELSEKVLNTLTRIETQDTRYRKNRVWARAKNDFYFQLTGIVNKYSDEELKKVEVQLSEGINWYLTEIEMAVDSVNKKLEVPFPRDEFKIKKTDHFGLKILKLRKRWSSPFSKKAILLRHNYKKILTFYLKENAFRQLNEFLIWFNQVGQGFVASIRDAVLLIENEFEGLQKTILTPKFPSEKFDALKQAVIIRLEELDKENAQVEISSNNWLLEEFRKNLQLLCTDLTKINANKVVSRKRRKKKFYQNLKQESLSLPEGWLENKVLYTNLIKLDLQVFSLQFRLVEELKDFILNLNQKIESGLLLKIKKFVDDIKSVTSPKDLPDLLLESNFLQQSEFLDLLHKGIDGVADSVPEKMRVIDLGITSDAEDVGPQLTSNEIPLKRVVKHFINFLLGSLIEVELKSLSEELKRIIFQLKDYLSYMHFELENIDSVSENEAEKVHEIIEEAINEINLEEEKVKKIREDFETDIKNNTNRAFEALSPHRIAKSSKEISQTFKEIQKKKSSGPIDKMVDDIRTGFKSFITRLLYSRSEGVLLARELSGNNNQRTISEQMLDLLDEINPEKKVFDAIPAYYKNLFSGRSSISEDFWIERPIEQSLFTKAWKHYLAGYHGAVMVVGERNSGKTAFCRYATKKNCAGKQVYSLFPSASGSISMKDFEVTLSNVTNLSGSVYEVFEKLPYQSVVIFNDLELWWESSEEGLNVINEILNLTKNYGSKCFFIMNMNQFAYQKMRELVSIDDYFISTIVCQPFDSEELKDLILIRHRSGGLKVAFGKIPEERISEIRMAGIFNRYFNYSAGNPGLALHIWLASVVKFGGEKLVMKTPQKPGLNVLQNLNPTWKVILAQLILHKRMDIAKLERVLRIELVEIEKNMNALLMAGLVSEKTTGLYIVNPVLDKFLGDYLHENGYL